MDWTGSGAAQTLETPEQVSTVLLWDRNLKFHIDEWELANGPPITISVFAHICSETAKSLSVGRRPEQTTFGAAPGRYRTVKKIPGPLLCQPRGLSQLQHSQPNLSVVSITVHEPWVEY